MNTDRHRYKIFVDLVCLLVAIALIGACGPKKDLQSVKDPFYEQWRVKAEEAKGNSAVEPPPIEEEPFAIVSPEEAEKEPPRAKKPLPTRPISMKMNNIDVSVLLRALARAANQNIILSEKVVGKININIHQAPWNEVFESILRTQGLSYTWEGDILRIMTAQDMEADLQAKTRKKELRLVQPPLTRIVAVKYTEAEDLSKTLEKFLSPDRAGQKTGSIMVDAHTNSLIVQALANDMQRILAVIKKLDRPTPQVLIEAHIVEAGKDVARELGVQWGGAYKGKSGDKTFGIGGSGVGTQNQSIGQPVDITSGSIVDLPAAGLAGFNPATLGVLYQRVGEYLLSAQLSALQDQGKLNILSSPSITTLDNQTALIESGSNIPFQTVEDGEVKIEYKKAVLKLEVTPHVIDGKTLKMAITVNKDEPDFSRTVLGNPTIVTKNARTNVIQNDGQTVVIGGLSREKSTRSQTGTPWFEDIPGLGYLFKRKSSADEMEDLLIFITPHILKPRVQGVKK